MEDIAKDTNMTKEKAATALNAILEGIQNALAGDEGKISLVGFGTFSKVHRKARQGVNPATGEKIKIKARNAVKFQPGKNLKNAVA
ncbi:DNA-binding protein [Desulfobacteraceae bacterium SEEP-SAG9]|nr:DNA-binding protein [Desulfobacteraceae bacterium SEEP-SAG9]